MGCSLITSPGDYAVSTDIPGTGPYCLHITTSDVTLDCGNHSVASVGISGHADNIVVRNCHLYSAQITNDRPYQPPGSISNVTITDVILDGQLSVTGSDSAGDIANVTIRRSRLAALALLDHVSTGSISDSSLAGLILTHASFVAVEQNRIAYGGLAVTAGVTLFFGSHNRVVRNSIDGGYYGSDTSGQGRDGPGADDGVVLGDETDDLIDENTIANVWDAGIEGASSVTNTTISHNTIRNAPFAGISSYHCTRWRSNRISDNVVVGSQYGMLITYQVTDRCLPSPAPGAFADNQILNNDFSAGSRAFGLLATLFGVADVGNNLIQANDFGAAAPVNIRPPAGFVDGGANVCGSANALRCSGH